MWQTRYTTGTSSIMLSGETAAGKYPVLAVETMARIALETEAHIDYNERFHRTDFRIKNLLDAISHATSGMAIDIHAKAIVVCSLSGTTARMVSRFRCPVDILGLTIHKRTWRKLALSWGVTRCSVRPTIRLMCCSITPSRRQRRPSTWKRATMW